MSGSRNEENYTGLASIDGYSSLLIHFCRCFPISMEPNQITKKKLSLVRDFLDNFNTLNVLVGRDADHSLSSRAEVVNE
jgi:hypothetical protein